MFDWINRLRQPMARAGGERAGLSHWVWLSLIAGVFVLLATTLIALDSFLAQDDLAGLAIGSIAPRDIHAPFDWRYESQSLTERQRALARASTPPVYDPPNPEVARQQVQLTRQILDYIHNIREDPFGSPEQKLDDIQQVTALTLEPEATAYLLSLTDDAWRALDGEIISVLERVMRGAIREADLATVRAQLPTQVSIRFSEGDISTIVAIIEDLLRPNTLPNPEASEAAAEAAAAAVVPEIREFVRGQIIVREGTRIQEVDYETLNQFGLLRPSNDQRWEQIVSAFLASLLVLLAAAMFLIRSRSPLLRDVRLLALIAGLFLIFLGVARFFDAGEQIYIYPTAALALLLVALVGADIAILAALALALLIGLMVDVSLEVATLVAFGGVIGALSLRRAERLNTFFIAGVTIALSNMLVIGMFTLNNVLLAAQRDSGILLLYGAVNGVFAAAVALAGLYVVTLLFNLPTTLKLIELSQPSQPLLQRLLREAPGTYQHSLQVANLSEQAASTIGANAELVRVAALYHDIGKMLNPAFFVENQADQVNPHDVLNDPYRSADIIISHVTDGDRLARQYRLPRRIRDFILEHHGTTRVAYFYQKAVDGAGGDPDSVDLDQFTYPGPRPQSRETAIMMLADSCESTVRARKPTDKAQIAEIIQQIIDARTREGQLDDSGLTSNDMRDIRGIFVEMLQGVFHPRINYPALQPAQYSAAPLISPPDAVRELPPPVTVTADPVAPTRPSRAPAPAEETPPVALEDDDQPLAEIPPLRRTGINRRVDNGQDGEPDDEDALSEEQKRNTE
jgi:hypothetical protein